MQPALGLVSQTLFLQTHASLLFPVEHDAIFLSFIHELFKSELTGIPWAALPFSLLASPAPDLLSDSLLLFFQIALRALNMTSTHLA